MLRFSITSLCLCIISFCSAVTGQLVDYKVEKRFPPEELKVFFKQQHIPKIVLPVNLGINIYEVVYKTSYADGNEVTASGLVYVPMLADKPLPLMIYNHGTEMCRDRSCDYTGEQSICLAFATDGYIVMCPDYVGLGKSDKSQLYLNAASEAHSSVDMLRSLQVFLPLMGASLNHQLFVTGYSQGGHAAMATTKLLQEEYGNEYKVTASAPMSGPYDVENTVYNARNQKFSYPGFLFLLLQSYYESKGEFHKMKEVLNPPYDVTIPPLLDGNTPIEELDKEIPDSVFRTIKPKFYDEFINHPESGFRKYLRSNNVYDWKPEMHMMLSYCDADEEVSYKNSITAYETMKKNGAKNVELWRAGKKFGHVNCALFAVIYTKMYFDGFRHGRPGYHGPAFKRMLLNLGKLAVKPR